MKSIKSGQHGGKRAGAGRKPGSATTKTREIANAAAAAGLSPLEYMLQVMRDGRADDKRRDEMAKAAAPYVHPRLSSIDAKVEGDVGLTVEIVRFGQA